MSIQEVIASISEADKKFLSERKSEVRRSTIETGSKRQGKEREWPKAGEVVIARNPWTAKEHQVQVVSNPKRKHRVEFEIDSGRRFHSPSPLCQYLFGKRVSNGWDCISWF